MKKTKTKQGTEALTGKELLQKLKELSHLSRRAKARECGYVSEVKDGNIRVNIGGFLNAVLAAKGVTLDIENDKDGRGREATYRTSVHKNGQIVLGSAYTEAMGLKVGDEFEIKLGYKHIHLKQIEAEDDVE
ncbi:MAG: AbrB family transcriptional regulator [Thermosynechococcaceae cyanobacterium MS004]|nr:AbrB family transcriptional regulator [Thermosynechococcaceae cyanobacterium MS004]